ncbi:hypothetical protein Tco_1406461 [Tanacetum coccineum]
MAPLPPREQRHRFLRYEGLEYTDSDITDFEGRLARIHMREVHRVPVFDFGGLPDLMAEGLTARMLMEHRDESGEEMQTAEFGVYWAGSARQIPGKGGLRDYWMGISSTGDFLGTIPSYTAIRDPILRMKRGAKDFCGKLRGLDMGKSWTLRMHRSFTRVSAVPGNPCSTTQAPPLYQPPPALPRTITPELGVIKKRGGWYKDQLGCWELTWTCGEIDDRSGEILHMVDDVHDAVDGC